MGRGAHPHDTQALLRALGRSSPAERHQRRMLCPACVGGAATSRCQPVTKARAIRNERYHCLPIAWYYWPMVIRRDEYLVTTARDLGAALKHFRTAAGVTQVAAAEAGGVGRPSLSALKGGKCGSWRPLVWRRLRLTGGGAIVGQGNPRG